MHFVEEMEQNYKITFETFETLPPLRCNLTSFLFENNILPKGFPAMEIQVILRTWSSIRTDSLEIPVILGRPGGSEKRKHKNMFF